MDLEECRREIDVLDRDLTKILERRMQVVAEVAAYKKEHHMEIYDPRRERQVLDKIANLTGYALLQIASELRRNLLGDAIVAINALMHFLGGIDRH